MLSPTANQKVGNEDTKRGTGVDNSDRENVKISDKERNLQTNHTKMKITNRSNKEEKQQINWTKKNVSMKWQVYLQLA